MLILNKKYLVFTFLLFAGTWGFSQPAEEEFGYYIFPINPGVRNTLAGTMGELRSTHFHTGIDIRTGGQQGLAVVAAAEGHTGPGWPFAAAALSARPRRGRAVLRGCFPARLKALCRW